MLGYIKEGKLMRKILIDINHNKIDIKNVVQGIKLFLHDEKTYSIVAVGRQEDMLTLKEFKGVEVIYADKIYSQESDMEDEDISLTKCFQLMRDNNDKYDAFVCSASLDVIKAYSQKYLEKISEFPTFITEFPNAFTGRKSALLDLGYVLNPTSEELIGMQKLGEIYTKKALYSSNFSFKLLTNVDRPELDKSTNLLTDSHFEKLDGYKGFLKVEDIFTPDCKLIVGDASMVSTMIQSTHTMFDLYENYINKAISSDFKTKVGSRLMNSAFQQINSSIDKKFTSGGTVLLGYNTNLVAANSTTTSTGFKSSIILAKTLARCKINEEISK